MSDPSPPPHLDDEDLSALLDGMGGEIGAAHLRGCARCAARRDALATARDAVREAVVAPLPTTVLDGLVGTALDAPAVVVPIESVRRRRLSSPPPAWLLGAVASIALLAGLAGLIRSGDARDDRLRVADDDGRAALAESSTGAARVDAATVGAVEPDIVTSDLGDIDGTGALTAALDAPDTRAFRSAPAADGAEETAPAQDRTPTTPAGGAGGSATASAPAVDRAQCRVEAERAGAGRLGPLQATATLRWGGRPAEVLVFALAEPADGFSRQALVLARPGCELLADPRF